MTLLSSSSSVRARVENWKPYGVAPWRSLIVAAIATAVSTSHEAIGFWVVSATNVPGLKNVTKCASISLYLLLDRPMGRNMGRSALAPCGGLFQLARAPAFGTALPVNGACKQSPP